MGLGALAVWKGVQSIEKVNKVLIPALLLIVVIALIRAVTLPGAGAGLAFLFTPQWDLLAQPSLWLEALTQNAWDTGAGWGLILPMARTWSTSMASSKTPSSLASATTSSR
jgi:NSS family neurotransmitter:Na+ symporter